MQFLCVVKKAFIAWSWKQNTNGLTVSIKWRVEKKIVSVSLNCKVKIIISDYSPCQCWIREPDHVLSSKVAGREQLFVSFKTWFIVMMNPLIQVMMSANCFGLPLSVEQLGLNSPWSKMKSMDELDMNNSGERCFSDNTSFPDLFFSFLDWKLVDTQPSPSLITFNKVDFAKLLRQKSMLHPVQARRPDVRFTIQKKW